VNVTRTKYNFAIKSLNVAEQRVEALQTAAAKSNDEICQTLGKVLGFPWYKDDLDLFPGATESDGVCVGDHVAETLAVQAADRIRHLDSRLQIDTLNPNRRNHIVILSGRIDELEARIAKALAHIKENYEDQEPSMTPEELKSILKTEVTK
jgi:hypothetical protein